jgi:hypothetical protein
MTMAPYRQVIADAIADGSVDPRDEMALFANVTRALNMSRDAGRPSDAARSAVWEYKQVGRDEFLRRMGMKPSGFYPDD